MNAELMLFTHRMKMDTKVTVTIDSSKEGFTALIELMEICCGAILPGGIIANLCTAHGTSLLSLEPRLDALITEYMTALEYNRRNVRIMANGTDGAGSL